MSSKTHITCDVTGFYVKKFTTVEGKKEEDAGTITLTLSGSKEDVRPEYALGMLNVSDVVAALNLSQESREPVQIKLTFAVPSDIAEKISESRKTK